MKFRVWFWLGQVRSWEIHAALTGGRGKFSFIFEAAEVIDRNPPPSNGLEPLDVGHVVIRSTVSCEDLYLTLQGYPDPPQVFKSTPDVETLWHRYEGYLDGKEPVLSMANFCLTYIEWISTKHFLKTIKRKAVESYFAVHKDILHKLSGLAATAGDLTTARKVDGHSTLRALSSREIHWVEEAAKLLIRRVGEHGSRASLPVVTMANLPTL